MADVAMGERLEGRHIGRSVVALIASLVRHLETKGLETSRSGITICDSLG